MNTLSLKDFVKKCMIEKVSQSDMHNFIQEHTNNFNTTKLELLKNDLNDFTKAIKFTIIKEVKDNAGAVEQTDSNTTIGEYIDNYIDVNEIDVLDIPNLPVFNIPTAKLNFVINDIEERWFNFEVKGIKYGIISDEYFGFFDFCNMVFNLKRLEQIYEKRNNETTPPPKPFAGLLIDLDDKQLNKLFKFLTDENKAFPKLTFIDIKTTDRDSFDYVFGSKEKPNKFIPIEWQANNYFLGDILEGLQIKKTYDKNETLQLSNEVKRQAAKYFNKCGKPITTLQKSKSELHKRTEYKKISKFLADI